MASPARRAVPEALLTDTRTVQVTDRSVATAGGPQTSAVPGAVLVIAGGMVLALLLLSPAYGFHGDEMYFVVAGQHPAFGYVDQPPLTPLLSALSVAFLGVSPTAVRVLPALEMGLVVVLVALIARELGGSRRAQVLAASLAGLSGYLGAGHLDTTTDPDLLAWALVLWLVVRLLDGGDRRSWLVVGLVTGIGLENKTTLLFLGVGLAAGLLLARRWEVIRSPWAWSGVAIAIVLWLPNLIWQATNGWPQLEMAQAIAGYADENRAQVLPLLWLFTGPLLFPVSLAGLAWILVAKDAAPWRTIGFGALVALLLAVVSGGKAYYAIGSAPVFMAAGANLVDRWLGRGHTIAKGTGLVVIAVLSGAFIVLLTLPVLPLNTYARSDLPAAVPDVANTVGWPAFVATVEDVVKGLPPNSAIGPSSSPTTTARQAPSSSSGPTCRPCTPVTTATGPGVRRRRIARWSSTSVIGGQPTGAPTSPIAGTRQPWTTASASTMASKAPGCRSAPGLVQPWSRMWPALRTIS